LGIDIHSDKADAYDIGLHNNTSEEILFAAKEMVAKNKETNTKPYIKLNIFKQLVNIKSKVRMIKGLNDPESLFLPLLNLVTPHEIRISHHFILSNPQFLGHNWINEQSLPLEKISESIELGEHLSEKNIDEAYDFFLNYIQKFGKNERVYNIITLEFSPLNRLELI